MARLRSLVVALTLALALGLAPAAGAATRHHDEHRWHIRYSEGIPALGKRWLARLRYCESTNRRYARNGPYFSYYQFDLGTWRSVGGVGKPWDVGLYEQSVRTWHLRLRRGTRPWPRCG